MAIIKPISLQVLIVKWKVGLVMKKASTPREFLKDKFDQKNKLLF